MKIQMPPAAAPPKNTARRADAARAEAPPMTVADVEAALSEPVPNEANERTFASVLKDLAQTPKSNKPKTDKNKLTETAPAKDGDEREIKTARQTRSAISDAVTDSTGEDDTNGGADDAAHRHASGLETTPPPALPTREVVRTEATTAPNARLILHIADLERIVASVRTQTIAERREVTISLHRSVLEGLQVKLSSDTDGRIHAEFIAGSEQSRTQIDARTAELSSLLRGRGVDLAELKTSVGTSAGQENGDRRQRDSALPVGEVGMRADAPDADEVAPLEYQITSTNYTA